MSSRTDPKVLRLRNTIIGFVVVVAILVIGYGTLYSSGVTTGEFVAGEHYTVIEQPARQRLGEPLEVREFFSYACIHCRNFEPLVHDWSQALPDGVRFVRKPVSFSPIWEILARSYYALETAGALQANHERLFRAIHDNGRQFLTAEMVADFVDGNDITRDAFLAAYRSPAVGRATRDAQRQAQDLRVSGVPTLVIAGKYMITMDAGRKVALEIADHLLAQELASAAGP